jgi:hypothetical protein
VGHRPGRVRMYNHLQTNSNDMTKRRLCFAMFLICVALLEAQERPQTPGGASATVVGPKIYRAGDNVTVLLRLSPAPDGYRGGEVRCFFQNTSVPPASLGSSMQTDAIATVPMQDGVSEYSIRVNITDYMTAGVWKLTSVDVGRASRTRVPVSDKDTTFEVLRDDRPLVVSLEGPAVVRNGTKATFTLKVDRVPSKLNDSLPQPAHCEDMLEVVFRPAGSSSGAQEPFPIRFHPGKLAYDVYFERLPDAQPTGKWEATISAGKYQWHNCPDPLPLTGQKRFTFEVLPTPDLVVPKSVEVTMNPTQVQLLRAEASALKVKVQKLENALNSGYAEGSGKILHDSVDDALARLSETESIYNREAGNADPAAHVFFDDIRRKYREVLNTLAAKDVSPVSAPRLVLAAETSDKNLSEAGAAVLASLFHNINAYNTVASAERLTFDLKVRSDPQGAKVSYCRKPDPYVPFDDVTNSTIPRLPVAVWFVQFQKDGYGDEERKYDATKETDPLIVKLLKRKAKPSH